MKVLSSSKILIFVLANLVGHEASRLQRLKEHAVQYSIDELKIRQAIICHPCHNDPRCAVVHDYLTCAHKCYYGSQSQLFEKRADCVDFYACEDECSYTSNYIPRPNECDLVFQCYECVLGHPRCQSFNDIPHCVAHPRSVSKEVQRTGSPDELMIRTWSCTECDTDRQCLEFMPVISCLRAHCPIPTTVSYKVCKEFESCYDWCYSLQNLVYYGSPPKCGMDPIRCLTCVKQKCQAPTSPPECLYRFAA
ncbi:uncharacterized protein LOC100187413 isoform X1 [Ciona intestinalis]